MATSALQKLLRKPPQPFRFITAFRPTQPPKNIPNPPPQRPHHNPLSPTLQQAQHLAGSTHIFPSFPFGIFPDPVFTSEVQSPDDVAVEDSGTLYADSVKKKRKRKMNKHKYQKLRKRMRRQT